MVCLVFYYYASTPAARPSRFSCHRVDGGERYRLARHRRDASATPSTRHHNTAQAAHTFQRVDMDHGGTVDAHELTALLIRPGWSHLPAEPRSTPHQMKIIRRDRRRGINPVVDPGRR